MKKNIQPLFCAVVTTMAANVLGMLYRTKTGVSYTPFLYASVILILFVVWNKVSATNEAQRLQTVTYREYVDAFESQKQQVSSDYASFVKHYENAVIKTQLWMACCFAIVGIFAFSLGVMGYTSSFFRLLDSLAVYIFWGLFAWLKRIPSEEIDKDSILDRESYKSFYRILDEVFWDERKKPVLVKANSSSFNVAKVNGRIAIGIGPLAISVLNEDEFKQLLIFEKGYLSNKKRGACDKADELLNHHGRLVEYATHISFVEALYIDKLIYLARYANFANRVAATYYEKLAYQYVKDNGNISQLLSGIMKLRMLYLFQSYDEDISINFYESSTPQSGWYSYELGCFINAFNEKKDFWKRIISNELPYFADTNLSFSEALIVADNPSFEVILSDTIDKTDEADYSYKRDQQLYREYWNQRLYAAVCEDYDRNRQHEWECHQHVIEEYLDNPLAQSDYNSAELRRVLDACYATNQIELLDKLCRACIEKYGDNKCSAHAHYLLGISLLHRYQEDGIAHIYTAMYNNNKYVDKGFDEIERFCSVMGLKEELDICKNNRIIKMQKMSDTNADDINYLRQGDMLSEETDLLEEQQIENINTIKRICEGNLAELYQIHKTVSEELFTTVYVVKYKDDVSKEKANEYNTKIFNYLDSLEWQYSLFNREEVYIADLPGRII